MFVTQAEPFPDVDLDTLENALEKQIMDLQNSTIRERELQKVRNQLEAAFIFAQDSFLHQAILLARCELAAGWRKINDYIPAIRSVTAEDVKKAVRRYLVRENRTTGVLVPRE